MGNEQLNDLSDHGDALERKLRHIKRGLNKLFMKAADIDGEDFFEYEVIYEESKLMWDKFENIWEELDALYTSQGASAYPPDWETDYDAIQGKYIK